MHCVCKRFILRRSVWIGITLGWIPRPSGPKSTIPCCFSNTGEWPEYLFLIIKSYIILFTTFFKIIPYRQDVMDICLLGFINNSITRWFIIISTAAIRPISAKVSSFPFKTVYFEQFTKTVQESKENYIKETVLFNETYIIAARFWSGSWTERVFYNLNILERRFFLSGISKIIFSLLNN